ncbi:phage integrase family protein [Streptomyces sp. Ag109_O5-1]|uniref:tyrosine-type recombinase/integrase n=1 Tax=Streptomyces sp. Ag109_O5-1 TaxID=1938851 RepID=UPI000F4E400C|nr:tyrosine-type recombinase/integrase [Streptomyces sp. Ag109_O5-1]RPE39687.1 phage integrase family protein [Streptomyces sp. Ag109_O5-1]
MDTSFDVKIRSIRIRKGVRKTSYVVRWTVNGDEFQDTLGTQALADSFRSTLVTATRKGEAFSTITGLPDSLGSKASTVNWYDFAVQYVDAVWDQTAAHGRRSMAQALMKATLALLRKEPHYEPVAVRRALQQYAFNKNKRDSAPSDMKAMLAFIERNTLSMAAWEDPAKVDDVLTAMETRLDGKAVAASSRRRHRNVLSGIFDHAIKRGVLKTDPIPRGMRDRIKTSSTLDKRRLLNPEQAQALLAWVHGQPRTGEILHAFFATMYYAGARPEEVTALRVRDVTLPPEDADDQWGELVFYEATPDVGSQWTDSGESYDKRHLKGRAEGDSRPVPCHPELTRILREEIRRRELEPGDLILRAFKGGKLHTMVIKKMWYKARKSVLTDDDMAFRKRVYDLRHTCLTTWLNSGIPPAQVAEWAGNSVPVLLRTYAHCIQGQFDHYKKRLEATHRLGGVA